MFGFSPTANSLASPPANSAASSQCQLLVNLRKLPPGLLLHRFIFGSTFTQSGAIVGYRLYLGDYTRVGLVTIGDDTVVGEGASKISSNLSPESMLAAIAG